MTSGVYKRTKEHNRKNSEALKGRQFSKETRRKNSEAHIGKNNPMYGRNGKDSPRWKDDEVGKIAIHAWIRRNYKLSNHCELCGKESEKRKLDLANLRNHKYRRNINDFIIICHKCHVNLDRGNIDIETVRELKKQIVYPKSRDMKQNRSPGL